MRIRTHSVQLFLRPPPVFRVRKHERRSEEKKRRNRVDGDSHAGGGARLPVNSK